MRKANIYKILKISNKNNENRAGFDKGFTSVRISKMEGKDVPRQGCQKVGVKEGEAL